MSSFDPDKNIRVLDIACCSGCDRGLCEFGYDCCSYATGRAYNQGTSNIIFIFKSGEMV